jgi:ligand-binding sensor domain-containing protein
MNAQKKGAVFYHLTTKNGLSCNRTSTVIQDSRGFYWVGTEDGLNRFDGSSCKVFRNIKNDSASISNNHCNNILEDAQGNIWISTSMGVNRYNYKEDKFERFFLHHPNISFDRANIIIGLQKDDQGNIWIASAGLWQYNIYSRKWKTFLHDPLDSSSIPEGIAWNLQYDRKNNSLWTRINDGYVLFDIKKSTFYHKKNNPLNIRLLEFQKSNPFTLDKNSRIWFSNDKEQLSYYDIINNTIYSYAYKITKGFYRLSSDDNKIWVHYWRGGTVIFDSQTGMIDSTFFSWSHPQSALSNSSVGFYKDKTGIYWINSSNGISIYNPFEQSVNYFLLPDGRKDFFGAATKIYCMLEQDENTVWLGTNTGLYKYDLAINKWDYLDHLPFERSTIKCLYLQKDTLWIGTENNLYFFDTRTEKIIKLISTGIHTEFILSDWENNIWVGTWHNGLYKFSSSGNLLKFFSKEEGSSKTIRHNNLIGWQTDSAKTHLWIGYNGGYGFCKLEFKENRFTQFKIETREHYFSAINTVNCISEEKNGNLWIGTNGGGLAYFDQRNGSFTIYTQSDGLKSNYVNAILPDESGDLWLATSNGLSILNSHTREIRDVPIELEMANNDFLPNGLLTKNKKMLFFAGTKLIEVDPLQFAQKKYSPEMLYSSFKIFDREFFLAEGKNGLSISLSHSQNFFSIEYSLLTPDPNSSTQYAYRLEGFDKDWNNVKGRRIAYYTNVSPGTYTFQVKAKDVSGKNFFSKPILISIAPPFWKTWWFIILTGVILLAGLYFIYRYRLGQLKKVYSLRSKISQDLHDEIGATLSSIHVYSSVAAKAIDKNPEKSLNALQHINENTRQVMENMSDIVWAINASNSSETSLEGKLKNYGYELLTPLNIRCIYSIDKEIEKKLVNIEARKNVLLIAKEAMNNIAKHSNATEAFVKLELADKYLFLEIKDNGNGFSMNTNYSGHGLNNMKRRTEVLKGVFKISSEKNIGTIIQCKIPVANISD